MKDIELNKKEIRILGKGNKERIVLFGSRCYQLINDYLDSFYRKYNINNSEYLLLMHMRLKMNQLIMRGLLLIRYYSKL